MTTDIKLYQKQLTRGCSSRRSGKTFVTCKKLIGYIYLTPPGSYISCILKKDNDLSWLRPMIVDLINEHGLKYKFTGSRKLLVDKEDGSGSLSVEFQTHSPGPSVAPFNPNQIKLDFRDY